MIATPNTIEPTPTLHPSTNRDEPLDTLGFPPPSHRTSVAPSLSPLSPRDEALLTTFVNASFTLSGLIRQEKMTFQALMDWFTQPHIKSAVKTLSEIAQARACLIASDDATRACTALQSCTVLSDVEFYEQADPATRQRAFESARKAANAVLKLAGLPRARSRVGPRAPAPQHPHAAAVPRSIHPAGAEAPGETAEPPLAPMNGRFQRHPPYGDLGSYYPRRTSEASIP